MPSNAHIIDHGSLKRGDKKVVHDYSPEAMSASPPTMPEGSFNNSRSMRRMGSKRHQQLYRERAAVTPPQGQPGAPGQHTRSSIGTVQYTLYLLLTCCSLAGMAIILMATGFPAFRAAFQACNRWGMWVALPILPAIWLAWGAVLCCVVALCNKLLLPSCCAPGRSLQLFSIDYVRWWTTQRLMQLVNQEFGYRLRGSDFMLWWLWALGAEVSPGAVVNTCDITEPHLLTLGKGCVLDTAVTVMTHEAKWGRIRFEYVTVGDSALVEAGAVLLPGACLEPGAKVPALTAARGLYKALVPVTSQEMTAMGSAGGHPPRGASMRRTMRRNPTLSRTMSTQGRDKDLYGAPPLLSYNLVLPQELVPEDEGRPLLFTAMQLVGLYAHGILTVLCGYLAYAISAALLDSYDVSPYPLLDVDLGYVMVAMCLMLSWKYFVFAPLFIMSISSTQLVWGFMEHMGEKYGVFGVLWVVIPAFWAAIAGAALSHALVKWTLLWRLQPRQYVRRSVQGLFIWLCQLIMESNFRSYYGTLMETPLLNMLLVMLGGDIAYSARLRIPINVMSHPDLLTMKARSRLGDCCSIITTTALSANKILAGQVVMCEDSMVGATSFLLPSSRLEQGAVLGVMSAATPGQSAGSNSLHLGSPSRHIMPLTVTHPPVSKLMDVLGLLMGFIQPALVALPTAIAVVAGIYPYAYVGKEHGPVPAAAAAVGCFYVFALSFVVVIVVCKWVLLPGRVTEQEMPAIGLFMTRRSLITVMHAVVINLIGDIIQASPLQTLYLRMRGVHMAWTTYFDTWLFADDDLATFSADTIIGHNAAVFCHLLFPKDGAMDQMVTHKCSTFGAGCCLMPRSFALPGADLSPGGLTLTLKVAAPKRKPVAPPPAAVKVPADGHSPPV